MNSFHLDIITPERSAFSQEVDALSVPTMRGMIGVLAHHMPLFSALTEGEITITVGKNVYYLAIGGGFMEVGKGKVSVLVSRAVHADELNELEIRRAYQAAKDAVNKQLKGEELASAQSVLRRSLLELKVIRRKKHVYAPSGSIPS